VITERLNCIPKKELMSSRSPQFVFLLIAKSVRNHHRNTRAECPLPLLSAVITETFRKSRPCGNLNAMLPTGPLLASNESTIYWPNSCDSGSKLASNIDDICQNPDLLKVI
jgi:hypothetical protein